MDDVADLEQAKSQLEMIQKTGITTTKATEMIVAHVAEHEKDDALRAQEKKPHSGEDYNPYFSKGRPQPRRGLLSCCFCLK